MDAPAFVAWLDRLEPSARDAAVEAHFGIAPDASSPAFDAPPGDDLIGHHASGIASILRALAEVAPSRDDVIVDIGAGLGKFALVARLLTPARVVGIELQPELARRARAAASRHRLDVEFVVGDACVSPALEAGSIFFLYLPFTGAVLAAVLSRLERIAHERSIVVVTLGLDLDRLAPWLTRRPLDDFWLAIYDAIWDSSVRNVRNLRDLKD